jgi:Leucine-rich repeat (LRR) protein
VECGYSDVRCEIHKTDLSRKTINGTFSFSGTPEQKETTLRIVFVRIGRVAHVPDNLAAEFPKLSRLWIEWSEIPIVKNKFFGPQFRRIKELALNDDKISMIEDGAFQNLPNLIWIYLNENKIKTLGAKLFQNNVKLKVISLYTNKIKSIAPETFQNLNELGYVHLTGNECVYQYFGCRNCKTKIDHTELNSDLLLCYENHKKSMDLLNEGENNFLKCTLHYHLLY